MGGCRGTESTAAGIYREGLAPMAAVEVWPMSSALLFPAAAAIAAGLGCYALFHGAAVLIERHQVRQRSARFAQPATWLTA
jgi:hypothetical protein